jgi:hypothetical protein
VVGFASMVPFMNTSQVGWHPVADYLQGADISYYVGFVVTAVVYSILRRMDRHQEAERAA